jgi:hypothetical protein
MNRLTKTLALTAVALAGAFGATAAQASAANFTVNFSIHNSDTSVSMIRVTSPLPSTVTGLIDPPSAISPGGSDPASGNAVYSDQLPALGLSKQMSLVYGKASDGTQQCTFTIKVSHDTNTQQPYLLHYTTSDSARCPVPGDSRSSDGQFPNPTSPPSWSS